jgi:endo-1,4-beta-xylanase
MNKLFIVFLLFLMACQPLEFIKKDSAGAPNPKFLGSHNASWKTNPHGPYLGSDPDFIHYWNQITPNNSGQWGPAETTRGVFDWTPLDIMYSFANANEIPVTEANFIQRPRQPDWIKSLSPSDQKAAVENWISSFCARYPNTKYITVVNEPIQEQPSYKAALGGDGVTGWDWVIWAFEKARQYCPNSKLFVNDYGTMLPLSKKRPQLKQLIQLLKDRGLIDGVEIEAHTDELSKTTAAWVKVALDEYASMNLPIYISELSIDNSSDAIQLAMYKQFFPVFWNHPNVIGVTLWGYKQNYAGGVHEADAYLIRSDGTHRPAMDWLMNYVWGSLVRPTSKKVSDGP